MSAVPVLKKLEDAGYEAYFVGGSVRDYLLEKPISDVDIATSATPAEVKAIFPKTVDIGIEHGTVLVLMNHRSYEVTTFRTEGEYQDYRRPKEVAFIRNLNDDLKRRDFTMNAIAMDLSGKIIDPYYGQQAIGKKVIQTVGAAADRFGEDALRMMRAVRFVSQLGFEIETETFDALLELNHLLEKIAVERKRAEFEKLLAGENWRDAIKILLDTHLYSFLPGLKNRRDLFEKLLRFENDRPEIKEMWALLLYCLEFTEKSIESFLRDWRLPVKEIKQIQQIVYFGRKRLNGGWSLFDLYTAGPDTIKAAESLSLIIKGIKEQESIDYWLEQYNKLPMKKRSEMKVTGSDLMEWYGQQGGPWLKDILMKVERAIVEGKLENNHHRIKEWLMTCSQN